MLKYLPISALYTLAHAEGEGARAAYQYFVKRLALSRWLARAGRPQRILIAGLPEALGSSLDFLQLAAECGARVTVADERPRVLAHHVRAWHAAQRQGRLRAVAPALVQVDSVAELSALSPVYDLCVSSGVLHKLAGPARALYTARLRRLAPAVALFAPNADNVTHRGHGVHRRELNELIAATAAYPGRPLPATGYGDMLPYPPTGHGVDARHPLAEASPLATSAVNGLELYARIEPLLPLSLRRSRSHLVYAFIAS
ncbi:MAG: hypothetical protein R3272_01615 [Candidatus Promineifilaceae bacterium]|nr:hypothetical protein [Candidatus Promineifilaceae bacterium]